MTDVFIQSLAGQSFIVLLLLGISWLLFRKQNKADEDNSKRITFLENKVETLTTQQIEKLTSLVMELKVVIHESNSVIKQNTEAMAKIDEFMETNLIVAKK